MTERVKLPSDYTTDVLRPDLGQAVNIVPGLPLETITTDLLVVAVKAPKDKDVDFELPGKLAAFDSERVHRALAECAAEAEFSGKSGSSTDIVLIAGGEVKRCILFGIGEGAESDVAKAAAFAVEKATGRVGSVALYVDGGADDFVAAIAEAANVAAYKDERYKGPKDQKKKPKNPPAEVVLVGASVVPESDVARGKAIAAGIMATKDVVTAPANSLTPEGLADAAKLVAKETGMDIEILDRAACQEKGMGLYLGVTQGSIREPQFIHITYKPEGGASKKIAYVGKAVTFDSGGYNLKVGAGSMINMMKWDMGGSGACIGAAAAIGRIKPKDVEVHFILPACENMVSERAIHPGDILTASNGKTVEIMNTDAEGRMCLADALVYAEKLGDMDAIIDIATLTGAIIVSLGHELAGFWSPSDELAELIQKSSEKGRERIWRMPLVEEYRESLKSKCADLKNIGERYGSSITAALFLSEFVETKKWAHLDIAGTAWVDKKGGATGYGVKTLLGLAESITQ